MTRRREELIRELAAQAAVPAGYRSVPARTLRWMFAAALAAVLVMAVREPLSGSALAGLLSAPGDAFAPALGVLVVVTASLAAFRSGAPSVVPPVRYALWPALLSFAWILLLVYAAQQPADAVEMHAKRAHCWLEVLGAAAPGLLLGVAAVRRLWPLHGAWSGALLGLAAGAIAAVAMDLACDPGARHSLAFHVVPGIALAVPGGLLGRRFLRVP